MEGISMKSIIKKLGAVSLLAFSLLFCGTYNKCEALKTVTALVLCEGKNTVGGFETIFARDIIGKLIKGKLFDKDIELSLTHAKDRDKKKIYDFLIYVSFFDDWHNYNYINGGSPFVRLIESNAAKNVIFCSIRSGEIDYLKLKKVDEEGSLKESPVLDDEDIEDTLEHFTGFDVNKLILPENTHRSKYCIRISKKNSFGCYFSFIDKKYKYEQTTTKKLNTKSLENLVKFMVKNSDCKDPIEYRTE
jgi:hypothetical protein